MNRLKDYRNTVVSNLKSIYECVLSPRANRHLYSSMIVLDRLDGSLKWGHKPQPTDILTHHQGIAGGLLNDRIYNRLIMFGGLNCDNASGLMIVNTDNGNKGFTSWKSGLQAYYNLDLSSNIVSIDSSGGNTNHYDDGIISMSVPLIVDPSKDVLDNMDGFSNYNPTNIGLTGAGGEPLLFGSNGSPPINYWGNFATNNKYIISARVHGLFYSKYNNILYKRDLSGTISKKYPNNTLEQIRTLESEWSDVIIEDPSDGIVVSFVQSVNPLSIDSTVGPYQSRIIEYTLLDSSDCKIEWSVFAKMNGTPNDAGMGGGCFGATLLQG